MRKVAGMLVHRRLPLMLAVLAIAMGSPFLGLGFQVDDYFHRATFLSPPGLEHLFHSPFENMFSFADGDPERTAKFVSRGMYPWYTLGTLQLRFWRPLTVATHWLDYTLWPNAPWLMHLHSLLWFGASIAVVTIFYRRMMGSTLVAGLAALLFALDDAHALPAGWIANRNVLIAVCLSVPAFILHVRWRREGRVWVYVMAVALFALALLAKEGAIAISAYLFAYALFLDKGPLFRRMLSLVPYAIVIILWRSYYQSSGYGAFGSAGYIDPARDPFALAGVVLQRGPVFLLGQWGFPPSDFYTFSPPAAQPIFVAFAFLYLLLLAPFFIPLIRRDPVARFWGLGMLLAIIPICSTGPMNRLLMFSSIGAMGLLAQFLLAVRRGELSMHPIFLKRLLRPVYRLMIVLHLFLAPILFVGMMFLFDFGSSMVVGLVDDVIPREGDIADKTLVLANTSLYPIGPYVHVFRALNDEPAPKSVRSLAAMSMALAPIEVKRLSETELRVTPQGGYGPSLFRGIDPPKVGDRFELGAVVVEIDQTGPDGWPSSVIFRFVKNLEDRTFLWMQMEGIHIVPWTPPEIGETVVLNDLGTSPR